jgi:aldose sugar dehydrogenase
MSSLNILALANIILLVSLMLFLIYVAYGHHNYHFIQAQDDVIFLETFEDDVIFLETFEGTLKVENVENVTGPTIHDPNLAVETVFEEINDSTNMAFLGPDDIVALEKITGKVRRIVNGNMLEKPLTDLNSYHQDGLVGIATSQNQNGSKYVFLFLNEAPLKYGADVDDGEEAKQVNRSLGYDRQGDRLYRYELVGNNLSHQKLLLELPVPQPNKHLGGQHRGGEILAGPDDAIYVMIGDLDGGKYNEKTKAQNYVDGTDPDGRAGILRLTQDGKPVGHGLLGNTYPLNLYYSYGIRNSFGMDFDPVTGNLWDTENGPDYGDEINLVEPGFNSGASVIEGMATKSDELDNLVDFDGKGKYSDPEFVWTIPVAPTAIKFFKSDKFGEAYKNDMFVADWNNGNIYHFELNYNRSELVLNGSLVDKVADTPQELQDVIFGEGFEGITDLQVGPEGDLYALADGKIYRIYAKTDRNQ